MNNATRPRRPLLGRPFRMPEPQLLALEAVFGPPVRGVRVVEQSRYARLHAGMAATTRPGRILLAGEGRDFAANPEFVLHEYWHVLGQWGPGRLSRTAYLLESLKRGYERNRFEVEARAFACEALDRYLAALTRRAKVSGGSSP